jgi:hypothetical protein
MMKICFNIFTFLLFPTLGIILYTISPTQKYSSGVLRLNTDFVQINVDNNSIIITVYDDDNENLLQDFDYDFWEKSNIKITLINNNNLIYTSKNETMYVIDDIFLEINNIHIISISDNWKKESNNHITYREKNYSLFNFYLIYFFIYIILFCIYYNYNIILFRNLTLGYSVLIFLNQNLFFHLGFIEKFANYFRVNNHLTMLRNEKVTIFLLISFFILFVISVYLVFKINDYNSKNIETIFICISFIFFFGPLSATLVTWRDNYNNEITNNFMKLITICLIYMYYMIYKRFFNVKSIDLYSIIFINFILNFILNFIVNLFSVNENRFVIILTVLFTMAIRIFNIFYIYSSINKFILFIHRCFKRILSKNERIKEIQINVIRTLLFTGFSLLSII